MMACGGPQVGADRRYRRYRNTVGGTWGAGREHDFSIKRAGLPGVPAAPLTSFRNDFC